jgi:hypothetical protein
MSKACSMRDRNKKHTRYYPENLKRRHQVGNLIVNGTIILKVDLTEI